MGLRKETSDAVNKSLQETLGEHKSLLTGFAGIATAIDEDGESKYYVFTHDQATLTQLLGLSRMLEIDLEQSVVDQYRKES